VNLRRRLTCTGIQFKLLSRPWNQDAYFTASPSADVSIFAVFDGHGKQNGKLAATTAARAVEAHLCANPSRLIEQPRETLAEVIYIYIFIYI